MLKPYVKSTSNLDQSGQIKTCRQSNGAEFVQFKIVL